jgi:hypothetical protein
MFAHNAKLVKKNLLWVEYQPYWPTRRQRLQASGQTEGLEGPRQVGLAFGEMTPAVVVDGDQPGVGEGVRRLERIIVCPWSRGTARAAWPRLRT